jgi:hypothetical protein
MPEGNVMWILVVSLIMFFGSTYIAYLPPYPTYTYGRDVWYYLETIARVFMTLTIGASALCIARFARKWTYYGSVALFSLSIILLMVFELRPLF